MKSSLVLGIAPCFDAWGQCRRVYMTPLTDAEITKVKNAIAQDNFQLFQSLPAD